MWLVGVWQCILLLQAREGWMLDDDERMSAAVLQRCKGLKRYEVGILAIGEWRLFCVNKVSLSVLRAECYLFLPTVLWTFCLNCSLLLFSRVARVNTCSKLTLPVIHGCCCPTLTSLSLLRLDPISTVATTDRWREFMASMETTKSRIPVPNVDRNLWIDNDDVDTLLSLRLTADGGCWILF